jgi:hypothetical protein
MRADVPFACDLSVFTAQERQRHEQVAGQIIALRQSVQEFDDGYAFRLPWDAYPLAAEFMRMEHLCCPFFRLMLEVEPGQGSIWLHLRGDSRIKVFARQEMGLP